WSVRAASSLSNGFSLRLAEQRVVVLPGSTAALTLTISDTLFHGRVTHRGNPVEGVININPAEPGAARSAVANLGPDGTFQVLLEKAGSYTVRVNAKQSRAGVKLSQPIAFDTPDEEISIELPTATISGRVVDKGGVPVERVGVLAKQQFGETPAEAGAGAGADGRFTLDYITPGTWELYAESKNTRSDAVAVTVARDVEGLTLVLDPITTISVRVVGVTGSPVERALVVGEFVHPETGEIASDVHSTNAQGMVSFRLSPWQQATQTNVYVATVPDARVSCVRRKLDADQTIAVPAQSGGVRLVRGRWTAARGVSPRLIAPSGCSVPLVGAKVERDAGGGEAMVMRGLAAGTWTYFEARSEEEEAALLAGRPSDLTRGRTFDVRSGVPTRVVLPNSE
ncbi:MAG TPA: carboxypeptidase regulatory-like domain-containing protein, partial [Thermoanaerobaculia bacterium]|nr:carboxypeptidase regulatory-like domain-containing protein [Thermoanaerobaculia bacterium]